MEIHGPTSPVTFNEILNAYGLELTPEAAVDLPINYAKVVDGKVVFDWKSMAFAPQDYHKIFTAYGLTLSPEDAATIPAAFKLLQGR